MKTITPANGLTADQFVAQILPTYLLDLLRGYLWKQKPPFHLREDIGVSLERGQQAAVQRYPELVRHIGLSKLETCASKVIKASGADDFRQCLLAVALANIKLVADGLYPFPGDAGHLVSLAIATEAEVDGEFWGSLQAAKEPARKVRAAYQELAIFGTKILRV